MVVYALPCLAPTRLPAKGHNPECGSIWLTEFLADAMSYQVLARKYRPATLAEVEGQPQTVEALSNAFDQQRLHHAYMFSGTRGVGKTTLARIIAKCLNCETGITSKPCLVCSNCKSISDGSFIDLVEVDGASRTKVEETRNLLEDISYQATQGAFKVFIIDEVHALSDSSFQTLLKSLEEPPDHVKFVLATTNPDKVPVTVRSRCMHFHLRSISLETIEAHLRSVLKTEEIGFEDAAVHLLARMGRGSMRDALSLTDQAIALCGGSIKETDVINMLGAAPISEVITLLELLVEGNRTRVFDAIEQLAMSGVDFAELLTALLSAIHALAIAKATDTQPPEEIQSLMAQCDDEWLQNSYQVLLMGGRDLQYAPEPRVGFEMTLLRLFDLVPIRMNDEQQASPDHVEQETTAQETDTPAYPTSPSNNVHDSAKLSPTAKAQANEPVGYLTPVTDVPPPPDYHRPSTETVRQKSTATGSSKPVQNSSNRASRSNHENQQDALENFWASGEPPYMQVFREDFKATISVVSTDQTKGDSR